MKKAELVLVCITAAFMCFLLGFFLGRREADGFTLDGKPGHSAQATDPTKSESSGRININTATSEQLQILPGIGEKIAQDIIDYRQKNGPFQSIEELLNVPLIGEKRLDDIADYITVDD